jgi:hypothetical protein
VSELQLLQGLETRIGMAVGIANVWSLVSSGLGVSEAISMRRDHLDVKPDGLPTIYSPQK